jgi:hypothetical protein
MAAKAANGNRLVAGEGVLYRLYMTGLVAGQLEIDSLQWLDIINIDFVVTVNMDFFSIHPYFQPTILSVVEASTPPAIVLPASPEPIAAGGVMNFQVSGSSGQTDSLVISLTSLAWADDDSHTSQVSPTLSGSNPLTFNWQPGAQDIGIWQATFEASDGLGGVTTGTVTMQVVSSEDYLVNFAVQESPNSAEALGLAHGDCDGDGAPEVIAAGTGIPHSYAVYEFESAFSETYTYYDGFNKRSPQFCYLNGDDTLDVIMNSWSGPKSFLGVGDNSFTPEEEYEATDILGYSSSLMNFDGNDYLDLVTNRQDGFTVFPGGPGGTFVNEIMYLTEDSALSVSAADFNGDGWDDVAVGTIAGLEIFLHDGVDSLVLSSSYSQTFGTRDIQVTNQGSDINNDGRFDLCLSTPSIGGTTSQLMVYLGNADGSFDQHLVRTVDGQIFANTVGDFNNDTHLDIAYVNGAKKYVGILFGDGTGEFENELRYPVPSFTPFVLDCADMDIDGDMDLVVSAYQIYDTAVMFCYLNQTDPLMLSAKFEVRAQDNARLEITAPGGAKLDETKQVMPASAFYKRSLNHNSALDAMTVSSVVEPGGYQLRVTPRPNLSANTPFSLCYQVNEKKFAIARDLAIPQGGYVFTVYPDGNSPIEPVLGAYVASPSPNFSWPDVGAMRFELAADPAFSSLLDSATVSGGNCTTSQILNDDSVTYYWRVYPVGGARIAAGFNSFVSVKVPTDAGDDGRPELPTKFALHPNYPNPFNPSTTIAYDLPVASQVTLQVYNLLGQQVATLVNGLESAGAKSVVWDGRDESGNPVTTGVYFYQLTAGSFKAGGKMLMLK